MNSRTLSMLCVLCLLCGAGVLFAAPAPTPSATPAPVAKSAPLWPQTIRMPEGTITLHPAALRSHGAKRLTGAVSVSILPVGALKPAHGRLEFSSPYHTYPATRSLVCYNATVRTMIFPTATSPAEQRLLRAMQSRVGLWEMNFPLSRLDAKQSADTVPDILPPLVAPPTPTPPVAPVRTTEAPVKADVPLVDPITVRYEGTPTFSLMTGTKNIYYATNSRGTVLRCSGTYYAEVQGCWYSSQSPRGGWKVAFSLPYVIRSESLTSYVTTSGVGGMGYSTGYSPGYVSSWIPIAPQHGYMIPNFRRYGTGVGYCSPFSLSANAPYAFRLEGNRWVRYNPNPTSPGDQPLPPRPGNPTRGRRGNTRQTQNTYDPYARWSFRDPVYFNRPPPQTSRQRGTQTIYGYQRDVRRTQQGYNPQQTSPRYTPQQTSPQQTSPRQSTPTRPRVPQTRVLKVSRK